MLRFISRLITPVPSRVSSGLSPIIATTRPPLHQHFYSSLTPRNFSARQSRNVSNLAGGRPLVDSNLLLLAYGARVVAQRSSIWDMSKRTYKTNKSVRKRFRRTANGLLKYGRSHTQHKLSKRRRATNRRLSQKGFMVERTKYLKKMLRQFGAKH